MAYLNGTEVAGNNVTGNPPADSYGGNVDSSIAEYPRDVMINSAKSLLVTGTNKRFDEQCR